MRPSRSFIIYNVCAFITAVREGRENASIRISLVLVVDENIYERLKKVKT